MRVCDPRTRIGELYKRRRQFRCAAAVNTVIIAQTIADNQLRERGALFQHGEHELSS